MFYNQVFGANRRFRRAHCVTPMEGAAGGAGGSAGRSSDGNDGGANDPGSKDDNQGGNDGGKDDKSKKPTFDEFLKDTDMQAEFDRRVQKALTTAQAKWQAATDDKLSEAEKLAKMTAEQKWAYLADKREKELEAREAELTRKELKATATATLAEKHLPVSLADTLDYSSAEACTKSIAAVEKAFTEAVQAAVEEKLKGGAPAKKATTPDAKKAEADAIFAAMQGGLTGTGYFGPAT